MIDTTVKRPVLRYHGGKWNLAKWIISHFAKHSGYTESLGGGCSVLLRKRRAKIVEVYNDKWILVVNVFCVLRDPHQAKELERLLGLTPFSREEFEYCSNLSNYENADPIEKARMLIFRSFAGFGSGATDPSYSTGFRANSMRSNTSPAGDWANYPNYIRTFSDRLKGVVIENRDYREVLTAFDRPDFLHYLDPPYVMKTRNSNGSKVYNQEFTNQDHIDMFKHIEKLKGMVLVSGYTCDLYEDLFKKWKCVSRSAYANGRSKRIECLWMNPLLASRQKQLEIWE